MAYSHTMPATIRAGDSTSWEAESTLYPPADGWALVYVLITAAARVSINASESGSGYAVALTPAATETLAAGTWRWSAYVERGADETAERVTVAFGTVEVLPDMAGEGAGEGLDMRSTAERMLDLVEAALTGTLSNAQESKQVSTSAGTMAIKYVPRSELLVLRSQLKAEVEAERAAARIANGEPPGRRIGARIWR